MGDHAPSQSQSAPSWSPPNHQPDNQLPGALEQPTATPLQTRPFVLPTPPPAMPSGPPDDIQTKPEQPRRSYIDLTQANFSITPPNPPKPGGGTGHASAAPPMVQAKCDACEAEFKSARDKTTVQTQAIAPSPDFSCLLGSPSPSLQRQPSPPQPKPPDPGDLTMADLMRLAPTTPENAAPVQRQSEGTAVAASHEVEAKIQQTKGSGHPLAEPIRAPMEQAFGADFSGVRIHTDGESHELNQAVQAKAFTTGQDIYFRSGAYEPGSRGGQELLAHELTHVVQQGGQMLQTKANTAKPILSEASHIGRDAAVPQGLGNPTFLWRLVQTKLALGTSQGDIHHRSASRNTIADAGVPLSTESVTTPSASPAELLPPQSLQAECDECDEETPVQLKSETSTSTSAESIQRLSWDDVSDAAGGAADWVGDQASGAAEWVGDRAEDVAELGADAFATIVEQVSPNLAALIRNGPDALLGETLEGGIQSWLQSILGDIDIGEAIAELQTNLGTAFATIQGVISGDQASCEAFAQGINSLRELAQSFMDNPAVQAIQEAFATVGKAFQTVTDFIVAPVFDTLMEVAGGIFEQVTGLASTIWEWGGAVRDYLSDAWDWVLEQLGIGGDGEGGILEWIQEKASAVWDQIKETFAPVIGPLQTVVTIMVALSPAGPIIAAVTYGPQIIEAVQWLWNNKDNPDIVKAAHEEMGNTILPQLLGAAQGFSETLQSTATTLISQVMQMSESVLQLLGAISGVPLLSIAQEMVQTISTNIQDFATWCQESFLEAVDGVQSLFTQIQEVLKPFMEVLTSLALAIGNPYMIPVMLAGWAWRAMPDCYKPPIIDFLLDAIIGILQALPELPLMGPLWPLLKSGVLGFLKGFKSREDDEKIAITNKLAKIISGASIDFIVGFVKGLLRGIWEGITDPFVLLYSAIQGLGNLIQWLNDTANSALEENPGSGSASSSSATETATAEDSVVADPAATAADTAAPTAPSEASQASEPMASGTIPPSERQVIGTRMREMGSELQPPAEQVTGGFMTAAQEAFSGGEGMNYEQLSQKLGEAWEAVENAIRNAGQELANKVCEFLLQDSAEGAMGEAVGWLAGTIVFEVILGILTAGSVTAAKGVMKVLKVFAKVLDWTGEVMGVAFKALAKLGGFVMDAVRGLGKLLSNAGGAARAVMDALTEIGEKFMRFADELLGRVGRGAAGDAAETAAERTARETAEAGAERTTQKSAGTVADRGARETTQEGAEKTSREATQETGDRGAREASDDPALKAAELPAAMAEARGITELNDATGTPAPILEGILNSTVKPRYSWLERFQARPKVEPGLYSIHLIASDHVVAGKYPKPRKVGNLAGGPLENATQTRGRFQLEGGPANGVLYRADDQGNITSYIVYDNDGLAIKRVDVTGAAHAGIPTPHVLDYGRNTLPNGTVRVHTPRGSMPRPANPDEIP